MPRTGPPVFFVSYARADAEHPPYRDNLEVFIKDLSARVAGELATPLEDVFFMDVNIHTGDLGSDRIRDAITQCRVGLALYSANYFTRRWCGIEFQVLLNRSRPGPGGTGIIPVRWTKNVIDPPECASRLQYQDAAFPPEYLSRGMRQLVALRSVAPQAYEDALEALADRVVAAARAERLAPLAHLNFEIVPSAWETSTAVDPRSHMRGNISKTCFVFLSRDGWDWVPYNGSLATIGALAQRIAGELGLRYEEIHCDADLSLKLMETNKNDVPTVLYCDPESLSAEPLALWLRQYDTQYLLNCAALVPWEPGSQDTIEIDQRWVRLKNEVCPQKVASPPPYHEWRSIFSPDDLSRKTWNVIEQIRSRLMNQLVSDQSNAGPLRRVEDVGVATSAAARGIKTGSLPSLSGPSR